MQKVQLLYHCRGKKISYFGLARNLIRHLISLNQDDLSDSSQTFHFRAANWVSCQTHSLWLENAVQCRRHTGRSSLAIATLFWLENAVHYRRHTGRSSIAITIFLAGQRRPVQTSHCGSRIAAAWTHKGTHLIYGFLARNPS